MSWTPSREEMRRSRDLSLFRAGFVAGAAGADRRWPDEAWYERGYQEGARACGIALRDAAAELDATGEEAP